MRIGSIGLLALSAGALVVGCQSRALHSSAFPDVPRAAAARSAEPAVLAAPEASSAVMDHPILLPQRAAYSAHATAQTPATPADVIRWSSRGVREDVIIERIVDSKGVFHLSAAQEMQLLDAGVSPTVIRAMKDTARH